MRKLNFLNLKQLSKKNQNRCKWQNLLEFKQGQSIKRKCRAQLGNLKKEKLIIKLREEANLNLLDLEPKMKMMNLKKLKLFKSRLDSHLLLNNL